MVIQDIRKYKKELRAKFRHLRVTMTPEEKREKDDRIFQQLIQSPHYQRAKTIICFVSTGIEVDTHRLIYYSLRHGKRVAVPRCLDGCGKMGFYYITSMNDLEPGFYALLEPNLDRCPQLTEYEGSICIVPGFSFDPHGFRLGYGKGYYDRFLSQYPQIKIGICYNNCISHKLPHGRYDVPVDYLFTERYVKRIRQDSIRRRKTHG